MSISEPGKKIKDICSMLGEPYTIKVIDLEYVIYRDLGNGYDFEISGLNNAKKSLNCTLYIWNNKNGHRIVERFTDINSVHQLQRHLEDSVAKYSK